jgi:hypothetical protein
MEASNVDATLPVLLFRTGTHWSFQNEGSGLFLTVASDSSHPAEKLIQSTFRNHGGTQKFLVVDSDEYSTLYPKSALGLLAIAHGSRTPNALLVQATPDDTASQQFDFADAGNGFVNLVSVATGLVIGISNGSTQWDAKTVQWTSSGSQDQQFQLLPASLGQAQLSAADLAANGNAILNAMRKFCPEVRLNPFESYFPIDVNTYVHASQVTPCARSRHWHGSSRSARRARWRDSREVEMGRHHAHRRRCRVTAGLVAERSLRAALSGIGSWHRIVDTAEWDG